LRAKPVACSVSTYSFCLGERNICRAWFEIYISTTDPTCLIWTNVYNVSFFNASESKTPCEI